MWRHEPVGHGMRDAKHVTLQGLLLKQRLGSQRNVKIQGEGEDQGGACKRDHARVEHKAALCVQRPEQECRRKE